MNMLQCAVLLIMWSMYNHEAPISVPLKKIAYWVSLFGHRFYEEYKGPREDVGNNHTLHPDAACAFKAMQAEALKDGITLLPVSGFRSVQRQKYLFFDKAKELGISLAERARWSAPPGFSEHHTGYAIDINTTDESFAMTPAFAWLQKNARRYNFELSFPKNNVQGIGYEPWHYRFIGTKKARAILYRTVGQK